MRGEAPPTGYENLRGLAYSRFSPGYVTLRRNVVVFERFAFTESLLLLLTSCATDRVFSLHLDYLSLPPLLRENIGPATQG